MATNDGGMAFPSTHYWSEEAMGYRPSAEGGMSLRDYFAGQALVALADLNDMAERGVMGIAKISYELADAMLAAREKGGA